MAQKRIAVNDTCVLTTGTGLHVVSTEITRELIQKAGDRLVIYTPSEELISAGAESARATSSLLSPDHGFKASVSRLAWLHSGFPLRMLKDKVSVAYSPVDEGMVWCPLPQIITCWDILVLLYPEIYPRKKYYYYYLMPLVLRACKAVICGSENTMKDIRREYRLPDKPMHVVYPGINHETFKPAESSFITANYGLNRYVLYVGEMRPYKNLERAVEAFSRARLPEHKFVIAGKKDEKFYPTLREKVEELKIEDRVLFTDYLPAEHLPGMYSGADVFVFPSLYEGFGMPPLEAMACGTPVVTSRKASLPEACGDAAFYVDPYNVDSIAQGIYKVATEPGLCQALIEKGFERARLFTWSKSADKVLGILDGIV
ncbi:MAG: glycosyltransferase family 1 protein [bacterium]